MFTRVICAMFDRSLTEKQKNQFDLSACVPTRSGNNNKAAFVCTINLTTDNSEVIKGIKTYMNFR